MRYGHPSDIMTESVVTVSEDDTAAHVAHTMEERGIRRVLVVSDGRLRGIVGIGGRVLPEIAPQAAPMRALRHLTLLIQHGTQDPLMPIERARATRDLFVDLGMMLGYREYPAAHEMSAGMADDACEFLSTQLDRFERVGAPPCLS